MNKTELKALVLRETGSDAIVPGYNYTIMSVLTRSPWNLRDRLKEVRDQIEKKAGVKLLDFVCLCRKRSVLVPVPFDASLNKVSNAIFETVKDVPFQTYKWS